MDILKTVLSAAGGFLVAFCVVYMTAFFITKMRRKKCGVKVPHGYKGSHEKMKEPILNKVDVMLILVAITLFSFTMKMIDLFETYMVVPDTLITCVFAVCGGECGILGWIKTSKEKYRDRKWQLADEKRMEEAAARAASNTST